jgi:transcriptional regulator
MTERIIKQCERHFGCSIKERSKARYCTRARAVALILLREQGLSHGQCANLLGISRCNAGNRWRAALQNTEIMDEVSKIRKLL